MPDSLLMSSPWLFNFLSIPQIMNQIRKIGKDIKKKTIKSSIESTRCWFPNAIYRIIHDKLPKYFVNIFLTFIEKKVGGADKKVFNEKIKFITITENDFFSHIFFYLILMWKNRKKIFPFKIVRTYSQASNAYISFPCNLLVDISFLSPKTSHKSPR